MLLGLRGPGQAGAQVGVDPGLWLALVLVPVTVSETKHHGGQDLRSVARKPAPWHLSNRNAFSQGAGGQLHRQQRAPNPTSSAMTQAWLLKQGHLALMGLG